MRTSFAGNIIPASRIDPVAKAINAFYPDPNITPVGANAFTQSNNYLSVNRGAQNMHQYTMRGDQRFSDQDSMYARFTYYNAYTNNCPCTFPSFCVERTLR